jgi:hypothetical protein
LTKGRLKGRLFLFVLAVWGLSFFLKLLLMSVLPRLAFSLKRRDEVPNQELAAEIAANNDVKAVEELVLLLGNKKKDIQHDAIKVLYEIAERRPSLVSGHMGVFLELLRSNNNRLQWGAMHALDSLAGENMAEIYNALPQIVDAAGKGSVITRDHAVAILVKLASVPVYNSEALALLREQLLKSPDNQLPMYAEMILPVVPAAERTAFSSLLSGRLEGIEKESKRKRLDKVIRKLSGK